jgi:hypothetical protein
VQCPPTNKKKLSKGHSCSSKQPVVFLASELCNPDFKGKLSLKYKIKPLAKCTTKGYSFGVLFYVREKSGCLLFFTLTMSQNVIVNDITNNVNVWGDRLCHFFLDHVIWHNLPTMIIHSYNSVRKVCWNTIFIFFNLLNLPPPTTVMSWWKWSHPCALCWVRHWLHSVGFTTTYH